MVLLKGLKWLLIIVFVLLSVLVISAAFLPATLIPRAMDYASSNGLIANPSIELDLSQLSGTLWNARAEQAQLTIDHGTVDLGRLDWQLDPFSLLDSLLSIHIQTNAKDHQLDLFIVANAKGEILIEKAEGHLPIALLEPWIPLLIDGELKFIIDHWLFSEEKLIDINGLLSLENSHWLGGDQIMPLGSYMAHLSMQDDIIAIKIDDFNAALAVDGSIDVNSNGNYHFKALLHARDELAPEVAESILWFGEKNTNGDIVINRRGSL